MEWPTDKFKRIVHVPHSPWVTLLGLLVLSAATGPNFLNGSIPGNFYPLINGNPKITGTHYYRVPGTSFRVGEFPYRRLFVSTSFHVNDLTCTHRFLIIVHRHTQSSCHVYELFAFYWFGN